MPDTPDPPYRIVDVNPELSRVYAPDEIYVGCVRLGHDGQWHPELPPRKSRRLAEWDLADAHEAIADHERTVGPRNKAGILPRKWPLVRP